VDAGTAPVLSQSTRSCGAVESIAGSFGMIQLGLMMGWAYVVVALDLGQVNRLADTGYLVKFARIAPQVGIVDHAARVALQMSMVNRVKPDQRGEQPPSGLGYPVPAQVSLPGKPGLKRAGGVASLTGPHAP